MTGSAVEGSAATAPLVLITGATGFLGRWLVEAALARGWRVRAAVRDPQASVATRWPRAVDVVPIDLTADEAHWRPRLHGVDAVIHAAGRAHVLRETERDPLAAFMALNRDATIRIARAAADEGVRRFVFVSSIGVHGNTSGHGVFSEATPFAPVTPYAASKVAAEEALRDLATRTRLEVTIVRPPLLHGPDVKANFLRLLRLVDLGWPLPFGAVRNRRSLVYVENLADLLVACASHPAAGGQSFLAGDGLTLSTPALMRELAARLGRPARLLPIPPRLLEGAASLAGRRHVVEQLCGSLEVDASLARTRLGWTPPVDAAKGLDRTVDWFRSRR